MRLIIKPDYQGMSSFAADLIIDRIILANPTQEKPFVLGLPTGSTPIGMYECLVKAYKERRVSFKNVVTFNMDEYVGIPEDHPESYHSFMSRNLFSHIDCPASNINILNGNAPDLEAECRRYEEKIDSYGGIDLFIGGIGSDGHIAFNEPYSSFKSKTRIKTLTQDTRLANARFFENNPQLVPETALTVGIATVLNAKEVLVLANGHGKATALKEAVEGAISQAWPISALQTHPHGLIVCDDAATYELKVGTYRYFKDIEKI